MRKFIPIAIIICVVVLAALIYFSVKNDAVDMSPTSQQSESAPPVIDEVSLSADNLKDGKLELYTRTGAVKEVRGAFDALDVTELSEDLNLLFEPTDPAEAEVYDIYYDEIGGLILVTLHQEPLEEARALAIKKLEEKLALTATDLCNLNVSVITNSYVNTTFAGIELGIPGCPDSLNLVVPAS
jgi:uncharacterized protein YpmB